jgi:hypothetical protein
MSPTRHLPSLQKDDSREGGFGCILPRLLRAPTIAATVWVAQTSTQAPAHAAFSAAALASFWLLPRVRQGSSAIGDPLLAVGLPGWLWALSWTPSSTSLRTPLYALDAARVWLAVREPATVEVDRSVVFTSDRAAVRAVMRAGFGFVHPQSVGRVTIARTAARSPLRCVGYSVHDQRNVTLGKVTLDAKAAARLEAFGAVEKVTSTSKGKRHVWRAGRAGAGMVAGDASGRGAVHSGVAATGCLAQ